MYPVQKNQTTRFVLPAVLLVAILVLYGSLGRSAASGVDFQLIIVPLVWGFYTWIVQPFFCKLVRST